MGSNPITPGVADLILPAHTLLLQDLIIKGDADMTAANIRKGIDLFGVIGTLEAGNCSMATGEVTPSYGTKKLTIAHSLGKVPQFFVLYEKTGFTARYCALFIHSPWSRFPDLAVYYSDAYSWEVDTVPTYTANASSIAVEAAWGFDDDTYVWAAIA